MIGKIIRLMRKKRGIQQKEMAIFLNIGQSTLSDYENNKISIDFETIKKIAKICNFEINFIDKEDEEIITSENIERKEI